MQEKLANVSDPDEYIKMAKEIGYNNLSPEQQEYVKSLEEEDVNFWERPIDYVSEKLDDIDDGVINLIEKGDEKLKEVLAPVDEAGKKYLGPVYDYIKAKEAAKEDFCMDTLHGVAALNKFLRNAIFHPVRTANSVIEFDYKKAWNASWDEVKEKWDKNFVHGDLYSRTHYAEYLKLNIVTTFISGGAGAASKGASIASKAGRFASMPENK
ncbi:hypothetical protein HOO54_03200 [Bacillus sp. WMMC1349]|uniref:hypothetical protein n=1 Tax=Bacillus sp. WMMC1349 TaxID=2736254 RepID=UPI001553E2E5|nr:hypothetical protein [Bacillus sp. WMMC1349]NPC90727.1 hypothetical protein [Bacillus sp. WMMC1349]NPC91279.1 hypothetical protein [Bacillus sp. WMMC1349]